MENPKTEHFNEIEHIDSITCLVGLQFPESANEFQKAALTIAHIMASVRESVLKGYEVPERVINVVHILSIIMAQNADSQK